MPGPDDMVERVGNAIEAAWQNWCQGDGRGRLREDVPVTVLAEAAIRCHEQALVDAGMADVQRRSDEIARDAAERRAELRHGLRGPGARFKL